MGDKISDTNEIYVNAVLLPDFSHLTPEQIANSPELQVESNEVDFGSMGDKEKVTQTLVLSNVGKSPLHFKQVQVFNKAKSRPRVLLITDDPKHSKEVININVQP